MATPVLISLSSFGAAEIGRHGQLWCAQLARVAGADSVEVRGELLRDPQGELPALAGLDLGMTFDMGNWHWVGECPLEAARALGRRVRYVHCKGAQRVPAKWVAVPLGDSIAPWRAVLRELPADVPHAIEYPLTGDDLLAVTRGQIDFIRALLRASP